MKDKLWQLFSRNLLLKGSLIMLVGSLLANFSSYLFHLIMGRLLGPVSYGILESLISITYILSIPFSVVTLVTVKFISSEKQEKEKVSLFVSKIINKTTIWGLIGFLLFILFFPLLKKLVKTDSFFLFLGVGLFSFLGIYTSIFLALFQGLADFVKFSIINVFGVWSKLIIAIVLVLLGFRLGGAIASIVISTALTVFLGYFLAKKYLSFDRKKQFSLRSAFKNIKFYSISVLIYNLSTTSFYTVDIILAKYFLFPNEAGQYAALSVLGKIIFFASSPLVSVMFPLISERHARGEKYKDVFWQSFVLVLIISMAVSLIYFLFPKNMVGLLFGREYLASAKYLGTFGLFISLYSMNVLFLNFFLSIARVKPVYMSLFFAIFQIIMICLFHNSIGEIILVNILSASLLLVSLLLIYFFNGKEKTSLSYSSGL